MKIFKIALGDLRHKTAGRHSAHMPLGIGYLASYLLSKFDAKHFDVQLFTDSDEILTDIDNRNPDIVGLSNYTWNTDLSRIVFQYAKKKNSKIICVAGGPEIPSDNQECRDYLLKREEIDFYIYREGEKAFANLVQKIQNGIGEDNLKSEPQDGVMTINPTTKELIVGKPVPKSTNLDEIPSPYLMGLMDKWFDGSYVPAIEIARGCPFTCSYCRASGFSLSQGGHFSAERTREDLIYIAKKIKNYPDIPLGICDSNFGMTEHDEEVAWHIRYTQDKFGWPNIFEVTTGRINHDRIFRIASVLNDKLHLTTSTQSLNSKTEEIIKRKNIPMDKYKEVQREIKKRGMGSYSELIIPMPEETKKSYFSSIKTLFDAEVNCIITYTLMLLKGTALASKEFRDKYKMQTKFRLLPRQFGEYRGRKSFEIEEVCISTNTMSFEDYLDCRGLALLSHFFSNKQFDFMYKHFRDYEIDSYDYLIKLWETIKSGTTELSSVYNKYIENTKKELFNSREEIFEYFSRQENYNKLLVGELGDNLIRNSETEIFLEYCVPSIEILYDVLKDLIKNKLTPGINESLDAAQQWIIANRNIEEIIKNKPFREQTRELGLKYDVASWYLSNDSRPLISYKNCVNYKISCNNSIENILNEMKKLYGEDLFFCVGKKIFVDHSTEEFWSKSKIQ